MSDIMTRFFFSLEEAGNMIDKLSNDDISKKLRKEYNKFKNINPPSRGDITEYYEKLEREINKLKIKIEKVLIPPPQPSRREVVIEKKSEQSPSKGQKKRKLGDNIISASSADVPLLQQPQKLPTINKATQEQREALIYAGLDEDDIYKYGIAGDHSEYENWWIKDEYGNYNEDILNIVAFEEERFHKYYNDTYTPGQLAKTYNKIAESFIIQNCTVCKGKLIIDYLSFIRNNPQFALPTLLWIDTFHDFKEERLNKSKRNLNDIIDYLCFQIYRHHWGKFQQDGTEAKKDDNGNLCYVIGHHYNFDKMYQNSFFVFNSKLEINGFHPDVKHTVLRTLIEDNPIFQGDYNTQKKVAELLYDVSNIFINTTGGWEADFLYAYLMYNFNFDMTKDGLIQNLRDVFWNEIKADKNVSNSIPYYAKDVDKGSSNFFKGTNVILPASLFDANRSNSSDVIEHFIPIPNTTIPLCNGYEFQYIYEAGKCNLTLKYTSKVNNQIQSFDLCDISNEFISSNNSSCVSLDKKKKDNYTQDIQKFIKKLEGHKKEEKQSLKEIDTSITKFLDLINSENKYNINNNYNNLLQTIKISVSNVYFQGSDMSGCVKIPNGQGMSPIDCVSVVIGLLIKAKDNRRYRNGNHPLSPISCKELDFWVALKRIGDFGQIMQCKQLGIPLFTNDNMQLLISMAACSSAIWTGDNSKVLWYDSNKDAILCNGLNPNMSSTICNKTRIDVTINNDNIIIGGALKLLDDLPTENDYNKINVPNDVQTNPVNDLLKNKIYTIPTIFETITKGKFIKDDLLSYIYLKIQEQGYLLQNNIEKLKTALFEELVKNNPLLSEDYKKYRLQFLILHPEINHQVTALHKDLTIIMEKMNIKAKEIININPYIISNLNLDYNTLNTLKQSLKNKTHSQGNANRYYDVIEKQLMGKDMGNYIQDTETLLQTAADIIESKYVDKLTELNDIRNGCVIDVEMGVDKKEEEKSNYRVVHH